MVRVGIISFAHMHAMSYARWLVESEEVECIGVFDEDKERRARMASHFRIPAFETAESFFSEKPDGVVICSENVNHLKWTEMAASHGSSILCEKPLATTLSDAQQMVDICAKSGVRLQTAFPCRFHTASSRMYQMLREGRIGRLLGIKATNHGMMPGGWFIDRRLSGGGAVIDHTVHVVDLIRWMTGVEVSEVYAEIDTLFNEGLPADDAGILTMTFKNGMFATLDASWSRPKSFPTWGDVTIDVTGTNGTLSLDMFAQTNTIYTDSDSRCRWENWGDDMDKGLVKSFVDMLETAGEPVVSGYDGLKAVEVALAAYESARTGLPVTLQ